MANTQNVHIRHIVVSHQPDQIQLQFAAGAWLVVGAGCIIRSMGLRLSCTTTYESASSLCRVLCALWSFAVSARWRLLFVMAVARAVYGGGCCFICIKRLCALRRECPAPEKSKKSLRFDFSAASVSEYVGLVIPGGQAPEYLALDEKVLTLVRDFVKAGKPIASICHGQQILAASGTPSSYGSWLMPSTRDVLP
jgi:hypothetical protein